jgi:hypothetical protein
MLVTAHLFRNILIIKTHIRQLKINFWMILFLRSQKVFDAISITVSCRWRIRECQWFSIAR